MISEFVEISNSVQHSLDKITNYMKRLTSEYDLKKRAISNLAMNLDIKWGDSLEQIDATKAGLVRLAQQYARVKKIESTLQSIRNGLRVPNDEVNETAKYAFKQLQFDPEYLTVLASAESYIDEETTKKGL